VALALCLGGSVLGAGCGVQLGRVRASSPTASSAAKAKKDCVACEKMCTVVGDAEKNGDAIAACKADCRKSCSD
jgi:hypothetical protein